jgi:hypothetical protein
MEASMLSMHQSKFVLDVQNHEKQSFCKNIKVTQQGINVTLNSFLASMELKNLFILGIVKQIRSCLQMAFEANNIFKKITYSSLLENCKPSLLVVLVCIKCMVVSWP